MKTSPANPSTLGRTFISWLVCGLVLTAASLGYGDEPTPTPGAVKAGQFDYQEIVLDNGLRVISLEDFSCPIVAVHLWYHVGSKDEDPARQGFAHMFEHMMFRGTDRLGSTDHFDLIRKTGGTCNAYTSFDQTVYTQTLPANQLNLALWLEAERMSMLKIDQDAFDTERKVVEEERRVGLNRPYGRLLENILPHLFPDHPYAWSTIGSIPHLRSASVPELRDFWKGHYVPNNATLIVVGAVKHAEVQQLAKRNFGWIPGYVEPARIAAPEWQPFEKEEITIKEKNAPTPIVGVCFRGVPLNHPDADAISVMTSILGGGESSRVYRRLVAEDESAVVAFAGALNLEQDGVIGCGAALTPLGGNMDKVIAALKEEIQEMQEEPVSELELEKVRNQSLRSLVTEGLTVSSKASALGSAAVLEGDASRVNTRLERLRRVTAEDVQRVAVKYMDLNNFLTIRVNRNLLGALGSLLGMKDDIEDAPITGAKETNAPTPGREGLSRPQDRLAASPIAGLLDFDTNSDFDELTLDNGLKVVVVENHETPYVSVYLGLDAGAVNESKPGTASTAFGLLTKGTKQHSEKELAEELESNAISLSGSAGMDTSGISMSCLPDQMDRGMRLLSEVVLEPTMPESEFKKLIKQTRTAMIVSEKEPSSIADREFRRRMYGDHPYARSSSGESKDLDELDLEDLKSWWQTYSRPDLATLVVAGDTDMAEVGQLVKQYLGSWTARGSKPVANAFELPERNNTHIYLVDNPGVQTQLRVGHLSFSHDDPSYFPSRVVSGYFGGAFSSRLNETIRVKKGLTYGARGGFSASKQAGSFRVSTYSKNDTAIEAVQAILEELERLQSERPSDKELNDTKSYFVGSYPSGRETPQQIASDVWFVKSMELPDDYYDQMLDGVKTTTAEECLQLATDNVHTDQLVIVVVGPAKKLRSDLEKIAPVTVVED